MKKLFKSLLLSFALGLAMLGAPMSTLQNNMIVAEAASHKNPEICGGNNYVTFDIHYGHSVKTVKIDGKTISKSKLVDYGLVMTPGYGCKRNCGFRNYGVKVKEGTHKVEVYDNKGYWTISYVKVY